VSVWPAATLTRISATIACMRNCGYSVLIKPPPCARVIAFVLNPQLHPRLAASWTTNFTWAMCSARGRSVHRVPGHVEHKNAIGTRRSKSRTILVFLSLASGPFQ